LLRSTADSDVSENFHRAFRKHSHAGSGAHEPIETARVNSDLAAKLLRRFRTVFDKIGNAEPREAGNRPGNEDAVQQLNMPTWAGGVWPLALVAVVALILFTRLSI